MRVFHRRCIGHFLDVGMKIYSEYRTMDSVPKQKVSLLFLLLTMEVQSCGDTTFLPTRRYNIRIPLRNPPPPFFFKKLPQKKYHYSQSGGYNK